MVVLRSLGINPDKTKPPDLSKGSEEDCKLVHAYAEMLAYQNSLEYKSQFATASLAFSIGQAKQNLQGLSGGRAKQHLEWAEKVMQEREKSDDEYP